MLRPTLRAAASSGARRLGIRNAPHGLRCVSTVTGPGGVRSTMPSSARPARSGDGTRHRHLDGDHGYLAFTKASLFKLTLPLAPPSEDPESPASKASSAAAQAERNAGSGSAHHHSDTTPSPSTPWEQRVDEGHVVSQVSKRAEPRRDDRRSQSSAVEERGSDRAEDEFDAEAPAHSVVFLLHAGQPLSYVSSLIRAEGPSARPIRSDKHGEHEPGTPPNDTLDRALPPITFHTRPRDPKRWSPATGFGDYLRDASRLGSFTIRIGEREILVDVPSFEDRTRFLRGNLYAKMEEIERMSRIKAECDKLAHVGTRRFAFAGAGVLGAWWVGVCYATFFTELGWDAMEPTTYLVGLGTLMGGYIWFLTHNREVSYRAVLNETTSKRQQSLYLARGLNLNRYEELIDDAKELRKQIKRVAGDYDLEWDQGETASAEKSKRALDVVRRREAADENGKNKKKDDDDDDDDDKHDDDDEHHDDDTHEDKDANGQPDATQRPQRPKKDARAALKEKKRDD